MSTSDTLSLSQDEMQEFLQQESKKLIKVFDNPVKFKIVLQIDEQAYKKLLIAGDTMSLILGVISGGGIGATITFINMSVWTSFLVGLGIISFPLTGPILGATVGAALFLGGKKMRKKFEKLLFDKTPKRINTPLDFFGEKVAEYLLMKGNTPNCRNALINELGYDAEFIKFKSKDIDVNRKTYKGLNFNKIFKEISKNEGLNESAIIRVIKRISC